MGVLCLRIIIFFFTKSIHVYFSHVFRDAVLFITCVNQAFEAGGVSILAS